MKSLTYMKSRKSRIILASIFLICVVFTGIFSGFIANHKPLYVEYNKQHFFPAFSSNKFINLEDKKGNSIRVNQDFVNWKELNPESIFFAPVPFSPNTHDYKNLNFSHPMKDFFSEKKKDYAEHSNHILGTDKLGRDVLAGIIHGSKLSLAIGFFSMLLALLLGLMTGCLAGFYGDRRLKVKAAVVLSLLLSLLFTWFYAFKLRKFQILKSFENSLWEILSEISTSLLVAVLITMIFYFIGRLVSRIAFLSGTIYLPLDSFISRAIEIFVSVPKLVFIVVLAAMFKASVTITILIIALCSWMSFSRLVRAEILKIREMDFITAARAIGFRDLYLIIWHILPNAITPIAVAFVFGISSAIMLESSLSFLGLGVPKDAPTWGRMIADGSSNISAWWLVVFPGIALSLTILSLNTIAGGITSTNNSKSTNQ